MDYENWMGVKHSGLGDGFYEFTPVRINDDGSQDIIIGMCLLTDVDGLIEQGAKRIMEVTDTFEPEVICRLYWAEDLPKPKAMKVDTIKGAEMTPDFVARRTLGYDGEKWIAYFWFVGWDCISFGIHVCLSAPNVELHLPFGFLRLGKKMPAPADAYIFVVSCTPAEPEGEG